MTQLTLLTNALVHAPELLGLRSLLVAGERIVWIGEKPPTLPKELACETLDLAGARLVPGLIDCHAHITGGGGEMGLRSKVPPVPLTRFTRGGVTSVIGVLGTDDTTRSTAELLARAHGLNEEGLSAWCHTGGYHVPPTTLTGSVRGDLVHLERCIGIGEVAISDHRSSQPTLDELLRLAADAHVAGLMTGKAGVLHLHVGDGERGLDLVRRALEHSEIPPRTFHPTHTNRKRRLFDEALALAAQGCTIDVTAYPLEKGEDAWSAEDAIERFLDSKLPRERITASTDGGGCLPVVDADKRIVAMDVGDPAMLARTLQKLLQRGRALEDILPVFTSNPARLFRLTQKGRIAVGADADLVVLDASGSVRDVMARGRWHIRAGEPLLRGMFEQ
ncbi:MAG: beta-aspartyl-peptidase [Planctomycetes bacterium]|nr:beta-aspartyl-peptidase [Planctomycetota bacterium]